MTQDLLIRSADKVVALSSSVAKRIVQADSGVEKED